MPRKEKKPPKKTGKAQGYIAGAGEIVEQDVGDTLRKNYMPYAMSVILSRALPEIDGLKPSQRKLLYTMYKMGLLTGARTKSANIVGQTMKLNPHGDAAIYDTMVRLSRGYEALLHPYVDSKGNFGKAYSRDMAWAAPRYTEAKLDGICKEFFNDIDRDTVDFADNYDSTMKEPLLLPASFPTILTNPSTGIAVGMACNICSFNLAEVCRTTIALMRDPETDLFETLLAPDFPGGGQLIFDRAQMERIYGTGRGSFRVRSKWGYDKSANCIDVTQIPPSTNVEVIVEKIIELAKGSKLKEVADVRDETDLTGMKITIDLKRGVDPEKLMQKLFKLTTLEDSFACNFNVLVAGVPRVMGVRELLEEWTAFRIECVRRRTYFDLTKKQEKLHLLKGLAAILLDIDKAIKIVRETDEEAEVVPNLMIGFGIDEVQAEFVAEIRLRHLNREYILKRTEETGQLEKDIKELEGILGSKAKIQNVIIKELEAVIKTYGQPRKTILLYAGEIEQAVITEEVPDYPVNLFFTREGYFKKITPQSLRMSGEQKLKEGDELSQQLEGQNVGELLFFSDKCQVYKARAFDFDDSKASVLGDYLPSKLISAYSDKSPVVAVIQLPEDGLVLLTASTGKLLLFHTGQIASKTTKNTQGVQAMNLKKGQRVISAQPYQEGSLKNEGRYKKKLPAAGSLPSEEEAGEQMKL